MYSKIDSGGMTKKASKEAQRRYGRSARKALGSGLAAKKSAAAVSRVLAHESYQKAQVILAYCAHGDELCVDELIETALMEGKEIAYPICDGRGGMVAAVASKEHFETDRYGIAEPILAYARIVTPEQIDLVLVPGVVFDERGSRLGWGAGYYDRYLPLCRRAFLMALAYEEQIIPEVRSDSWDKRMHAIATDRALIVIAGKPDEAMVTKRL